jgi:hypothetical protein
MTMIERPTSTGDAGNGTLPAARELSVEAGLRQYHGIAAERDELHRRLTTLESELAACRVVVEAQTVQLALADSRAEGAMAMRDQAISERAKWETLFATMLATLRTFEAPAAPLVKPAEVGNAQP